MPDAEFELGRQIAPDAGAEASPADRLDEGGSPMAGIVLGAVLGAVLWLALIWSVYVLI